MQLEVFGRAAELSEIERFLATPGTLPGALLLEGEAGSGKTTLWRHGVSGARERSWRVLSCAPAESEVSMSFAGLADLLGDGFDKVAASSLPAPQRRALRVALALEDSGGTPARSGSKPPEQRIRHSTGLPLDLTGLESWRPDKSAESVDRVDQGDARGRTRVPPGRGR
jgi:hypothetical protein